MAMCKYCHQDMTDADGCTVTEFDGVPRLTDHFAEPSGRCHDCGARHGHQHHPGCDVERCPTCHGQLISCDCQMDPP